MSSIPAEIFTVLRRLIGAGTGQAIHEAEAAELHAALDAVDPSIVEQKAADEAAASQAQKDAADFAEYKAWKDAQAAAGAAEAEASV